MKNQALFSSKDKSKKLKCRLLQFLFGTLRIKRAKLIFQSTAQYFWAIFLIQTAKQTSMQVFT